MSDRVFYIYSPPWVDWSAGTKVLHYLCDALNKIGEDSFLAIHGPKSKFEETRFGLETPILNKKLVEQHRRELKHTIVIYPEGITGNPLGGSTIVRWLLNYPSLLGGNKVFSKQENVWAYSRNIAEGYFLLSEVNIPVLFIPAIELAEIDSVSQVSAILGEYEVLYAQKFRALGGKPEVRSENRIIEITRFNLDSTSRSETLNLVKFAQKVHVFENTSIASEAALFGTPVICHKNKLFDTLIAEHELGTDGISWHPSTGMVTNPVNARRKLEEAWISVSQNLVLALENTVMGPDSLTLQSEISLPNRSVFSKHVFSRARVLIQQKGLVVFGRFMMNYVRRIINQV